MGSANGLEWPRTQRGNPDAFIFVASALEVKGKARLSRWSLVDQVDPILAVTKVELAPAFWKQTVQQQDTQQRLAANVFRTVTLAEHHANV